MNWLGYLRIGIMGFGGGTAIIPLVEQIFVHEMGLVTAAHMSGIVSISQIVPGALVANMVMFLGFQEAGMLGLVVAVISSVLPGALACISMTASWDSTVSWRSAVKDIVDGMKPAIMAMTISAALSIWISCAPDFQSAVLGSLGLALLAFTGIRPILVPLLTALLALLLTK